MSVNSKTNLRNFAILNTVNIKVKLMTLSSLSYRLDVHKRSLFQNLCIFPFFQQESTTHAEVDRQKSNEKRFETLMTPNTDPEVKSRM